MTTEINRITLATPYHSYLVRFWQSNEKGCWRASAQCIQSGKTMLFGTSEELLAFLQSEISVNRKGSPDITEFDTLPSPNNLQMTESKPK